jgi:hypothetical protein
MPRLTDALLVGGLVGGMLVALTGLVDSGNSPLSDETAARVNGVPIAADELRSLLERRSLEGAPVEQLQGTLDDMIDEELLIQRAIELGLPRRDSNIRVAIIAAMEKSILSEAAGRAISEGELEDFYRANLALFSEPRQLQVDELILDNPVEASSVADRLRNGEQAMDLAASMESVSLARLPPVPLSLDALARRYPQDLIARLQDADVGDVFVREVDTTTRVIRVSDVLEASVPPFEDVRLSVLNELQMQHQDRAYDEYLTWLRLRADIRRNGQLEASADTPAE